MLALNASNDIQDAFLQQENKKLQHIRACLFKKKGPRLHD